MNKAGCRFKPPILLILAALLLGGCAVQADPDRKLIYGLTLSPSGIDPHINASAELGIPLRSVYDTLIFLDPVTGEFVPGLATDWSISEDGKRYTFELRDDVVFHDATPFNAAAVKANIDYVLNPDHHSQKAAALLGPLESVDVIAPDVVVFNLQEPFAPLLDSLSQVYLGMASPQALERWGASEYQFHQVGTGPYRFVEYIPNDRILLERFDGYDWAPEIYREPHAGYREIEFRFFEDLATRAIALESGNVDILGEIPPIDAQRLSSSGEFSMHPVPIPGQPLQYLFNTKTEPTDDIRVRTALIHAVDRQMIVETIFMSTSPVALGPLSAEGFGHLLSTNQLAYDLTSAQELMREAGWIADQEGVLRDKDNTAMELTLIAPSWGSNPDVAQLVKVAWEALGAEVTLQIAPGFGPLREAQASGDYHAIGINFFGTDPDILRPMFTSTGLYNWSGYANNELDNSLRLAAQSSLDPVQRQRFYQESIEHITTQALVLPIRDYVNLVIADNDIAGLRYSAPGWFPLLIELKPTS